MLRLPALLERDTVLYRIPFRQTRHAMPETWS